MRILIYNWRDIKNPRAGGAEVFTHEVAKRWVAGGHRVTLFSGRGKHGLPAEEEIDGVRIIRRGGPITVYRHARHYYRSEGRACFDVILDEVNTRPFLCPTWVDDAPVVALVHQLAHDVWFHELPWAVGALGRLWLEPRWLRAYRSVPTLTISASSRDGLLTHGIERVVVVPIGLDVSVPDPLPPKEARPTVVFIGRMTPNKRPDHALRAFAQMRPAVPGAQMWVIGTGPLESWLRYRHGSDHVRFFGRVSEEQKTDLLARAHALVVTSVREGWGLVVSEAAALGTPTVGYDVAGLCDSIPASGGILVPPSVEALAATLGNVLPKWSNGDAPAVAPGGVVSWSEVAGVVLEHLERARRAGAR